MRLECSEASCYFTSVRFKYSPQHAILQHSQPNYSLSVKDQVSHPYKITGKVMVLDILTPTFLHSR